MKLSKIPSSISWDLNCSVWLITLLKVCWSSMSLRILKMAFGITTFFSALAVILDGDLLWPKFELSFMLKLTLSLILGDIGLVLILFVNKDETKADGVFAIIVINTEFSIRKFLRDMYCLRMCSGFLPLIAFYISLLTSSTTKIYIIKNINMLTSHLISKRFRFLFSLVLVISIFRADPSGLRPTFSLKLSISAFESKYKTKHLTNSLFWLWFLVAYLNNLLNDFKLCLKQIDNLLCFDFVWVIVFEYFN